MGSRFRRSTEAFGVHHDADIIVGDDGGMALALLLLLQGGSVTAEEVVARYRGWLGRDACLEERRADEVVVCARRDDDRDRLPLYRPALPRDRSPGAVDMADGTSAAGCGIFSHQRACSKADMRASGWGGGRDPVTAIGRLMTGIIDPDAVPGDPGPP